MKNTLYSPGIKGGIGFGMQEQKYLKSNSHTKITEIIGYQFPTAGAVSKSLFTVPNGKALTLTDILFFFTNVTGTVASNVGTISSSPTQLAYYPFNGNANDLSGNGYNGTVNGATLTTDRTGAVNRAYSFTGSQWITLQDTPFDITTNVTYCFGFRIDSFSSGQRILSKYTGTSVGHMEVYTTTPSGTLRLQFLFKGDTVNNPVNTNATFNIGEWYDVACTFNNTTGEVSVYVNGVLDVTNFQQPGMGNNSQSMTIGRRSTGSVSSDYFKGRIEYAVIYNRILSAAEILLVKNGAKSNIEDNTRVTAIGRTYADNVLFTQGGTITTNSIKNYRAISVGTSTAIGYNGFNRFYGGSNIMLSFPTTPVGAGGNITANIYLFGYYA